MIVTGWSEHLNGVPFTLHNQEDTSWVLNDTTILAGTENGIAQSVASNTLIGVIDGSFLQEHQFGTAGWIFEDNQGMHRCNGKACTPGPQDSHCSY